MDRISCNYRKEVTLMVPHMLPISSEHEFLVLFNNVRATNLVGAVFACAHMNEVLNGPFL